MASVTQPAKSFGDLVQHLVEQHHADAQASSGAQHPQTPPIPTTSQYILSSTDSRSHHARRLSLPSEYRISSPSTPSGRTGPPRSITGNYGLIVSNGFSGDSRDNPIQERDEFPFYEEQVHHDFPSATAPFRGALEYADPIQRERERGRAEKKAKRRESVIQDTLSFRKWLSESPKEDLPSGPSRLEKSTTHAHDTHAAEQARQNTPEASLAQLRRARSTPHTPDERGPGAAPKWGRLRSLFPHIASHYKSAVQAPSAVVPYSVNITDELIAGGLSTLMLRLWFERDEQDHRRVPLLFHRLRIRVSDSLHPLHGHKAVFRIECEYANGAVRWVVYRQLREFISLHTHYALSNAYNRNVDTLPEFPLTSLPYFKFLKERGKDVGRAGFARLQREALENYLIGLIRAVMFHPASNRLAGFLEISALSIALAQSGGAQYKAGLLRIDAVGNKTTFGRRGTTWRERKSQKWCSVRESYLVVHEEMGELAVWDVFLVDSDFKIERPTRYYRQGLNIFHQFEDHEEVHNEGHNNQIVQHDNQSHYLGVSSLRSSISRVFHIGHRGRRRADSHQTTSGRTVEDAPGRLLTPASSRSFNPSSPFLSNPALTPMLNPSTFTSPQGAPESHDHGEQGDEKKPQKQSPSDVSKHTFYVQNSQMRLKLFARNERQMLQWIAGLEKVARQSHYTGKNRFDSFAPIRLNVAAQWLVDGRDYFWNLSRAILLAKESIYIHDWWLSPELQMRRPNKPRYRLDHLLDRKAREGVKIYIILYLEVSSRTTPTDSNYTKQRLTALHPNILVQRSPSHFQTGTFYWAHHEKLCVIDQAIAFMGGLDLCFGRWDTPQHVLIDDPDTGPEASEYIWAGKDYSNPRIQDFHTLNKPDEDMYDRSKVPRMPWHDVSMQVVGQPARDLCRHFVQRWNYLLRIKNHSRAMPFLLPPSEFRPGELQQLGLTGTCELQICRSAGPWSMGTLDRIEQSIQNAYLKAIQVSEHFVYIENQFFITSTVVNEVKIENKIGDAIVHRIIRAHRERTPWKCCVLIPLIPGFSFPIDHSDASAIRIIVECQNRTICRGPNSIFGRLRKEGIDPDEYFTVFSLRNWAKLRGNVLATEEVYIHGKVCIVDDRLAIIGSANINERSQRGDRDSEIAAVIRDTDMIDCTMAGKPFKVGRFAHTLRVRLMREHIGVDVDAMYEDDLMASEPVKPPQEQEEWDPDVEQEDGKESDVAHVGKRERRNAAESLLHHTIDELEQAIHGIGDAGSKNTAAPDPQHDAELPHVKAGKNNADEEELKAPEARATLRKHQSAKLGSKPWTLPKPTPHVDPHGFEDPVCDAFWKNVWLACAVHNTEIYRKVFHAVPDDLVTTWKQYKEFIVHHERLNLSIKEHETPEALARVPSEAADEDAPGQPLMAENTAHVDDGLSARGQQGGDHVDSQPSSNTQPPTPPPAGTEKDARGRKTVKGVGLFSQADQEAMERLLEELRGHLVLYPTRFLEGEDSANNFLFNADRLLPLPIYD